MFKDIFIIQSNKQLHVYNYFNREQIDTINVGDYIEIELEYAEAVLARKIKDKNYTIFIKKEYIISIMIVE